MLVNTPAYLVSIVSILVPDNIMERLPTDIDFFLRIKILFI